MRCFLPRPRGSQCFGVFKEIRSLHGEEIHSNKRRKCFQRVRVYLINCLRSGHSTRFAPFIQQWTRKKTEGNLIWTLQSSYRGVSRRVNFVRLCRNDAKRACPTPGFLSVTPAHTHTHASSCEPHFDVKPNHELMVGRSFPPVSNTSIDQSEAAGGMIQWHAFN